MREINDIKEDEFKRFGWYCAGGNEAEGWVGLASSFLGFGTRLMVGQLLDIENFKNTGLGGEATQFVSGVLNLRGFCYI